MRLRNIKGAMESVIESPYVIIKPGLYKGKWQSLFSTQGPIHIEVGMGKGQFIMEMARRNPSICYLGIEKYSSVLLRALHKQEEEMLPNLRFIRMDAEYLTEVFAPQEVDYIYLNFSDPWPKDRHARRRLPSKEFLARYDYIMKPSGRVEFKTDNKDLFMFALEQIPLAGWNIELVTHDLHQNEEMMIGNIMTEYEQRFSQLGNPIHKYIISR